MATAKNRSSRPPRRFTRYILLAAVLIAAAGWYYREPIDGYTRVATAFGAHTVCSCRYVAGRSIGDCKKDFEPGMEILFLSDDEEARSVTASVPLIASETATFREGYGCVLEPWGG
ncbi:hypothetical protein FHS61_000908 [Altererythrobacter atlanticus]|uniref:Uncharacterized protein n=1 Tax=Croceibacterium atlanticum TaxID=1267766 RepID=A0A0F7KUT7_9SPHN|nr:hypothetical protein [Croceibacterium atlanticum]AKH43389.1 hypothetical protein WYH_02357 [Croceibacterium atlanticum]MBB5731904.1 hypothetical protein [Croceibacterium atlanticum]